MVNVGAKMSRGLTYTITCNEGTGFLEWTHDDPQTEQQVFNIFEGIYETEGIGEYDMPKDLDYIRDLWNVTIKEYTNE